MDNIEIMNEMCNPDIKSDVFEPEYRVTIPIYLKISSYIKGVDNAIKSFKQWVYTEILLWRNEMEWILYVGVEYYGTPNYLMSLIYYYKLFIDCGVDFGIKCVKKVSPGKVSLLYDELKTLPPILQTRFLLKLFMDFHIQKIKDLYPYHVKPCKH